MHRTSRGSSNPDPPNAEPKAIDWALAKLQPPTAAELRIAHRAGVDPNTLLAQFRDEYSAAVAADSQTIDRLTGGDQECGPLYCKLSDYLNEFASERYHEWWIAPLEAVALILGITDVDRISTAVRASGRVGQVLACEERPSARHNRSPLPRQRTREHRPGARRRTASSSRTSSADPGSEDSDPEPSEEGLCDCGCRPAKPRRFCACGCRREITHRRADAKTFGASCRQKLARAAACERLEPLAAKSCRCTSGFFYRDSEGDAVCGLCGCWLARVAAPADDDYDLCDAVMRANGVYVRPRALSKPWDDTQAAYKRREAAACS